MSVPHSKSESRFTARVIQRLASANSVTVTAASNDVFAHHVTRLSGDDVIFDDIENVIIALQRAGILDRIQAVRLQARYLRESRS